MAHSSLACLKHAVVQRSSQLAGINKNCGLKVGLGGGEFRYQNGLKSNSFVARHTGVYCKLGALSCIKFNDATHKKHIMYF